MPDFDRGFKIAAHHSGRDFCRLPHWQVDEWEPIGDTLQTTERLADRAFRARHGRHRFVVYFEAYTRWTDDAHWSILAKSGLLSERERLPTRSLVFVLTPHRYREQDGGFQLQVDGEQTQCVRFHPTCLWREQPQSWWEQVPGLMAMLPLTAHGRADEDAVTFAARKIAAKVEDTIVRANLLATLAFFGKLASPGLEVIDLIGVEKMRESKFFDEVIALGRMEQAQAYIGDALKLRFGPEAATEFTDTIKSIRDPERLSELHRLAIKCRGLGSFRRAVSAD